VTADRQGRRIEDMRPARGPLADVMHERDDMNTSRTRLLAVTAATAALVAGASAVVTAQSDAVDPFAPFAGGRGGFGLEQRLELRGLRGPGGGLRGLGAYDGFVRQETTLETDDGFVTRRVDNGTLVSASDTSVEYSLADGQSATASIDEDTEVVAFEEEIVEVGRRGLMRRHLSATSIEPTDLTAGAEVLVWAESEADGTYVAQRIVVQPEATADEDAAASEPDSDSSADAATEASPLESPASA
jgi:hypothetical protein